MGEAKAGLVEPVPLLGAEPGPNLEMPGLAYFDWRRFDPAVHLEQGDPMAEELTTFGLRLDELLPFEGQYALIQGREIRGIFPTRRQALDEAADRFGDRPALVKRIAALEPIEEAGHSLP